MSIRVGLRHMARSAVYRPAIYDAFRKRHEIKGSTEGAQTDYHVKVNIHRASGVDSGEDVYLEDKAKADFGDIRFTKADGITQLDHWMQSKEGTFIEDKQDISVSAVRYQAFPSIVKCSNGDLLIAYRDGVAHAGNDGVTITRRSIDNGVNWGSEVVAYDHPSYDCRDPQLHVAPNGNLILFVPITDMVATIHLGMKYAISLDNGLTFGDWSDFPNDGTIRSVAFSAHLINLGSTIYGVVNALSNNGDHETGGWGATLFKSTDNGASWEKVSVIDSSTNNLTAETTLAWIENDERFLTVSRDFGNTKTYKRISTNAEGTTWGGRIEIQSQVGVLKDPELTWLGTDLLILCGGHRDVTKIVCYESYDNGATFVNESLIEDYSTSPDGDYTSTVVLNSDTALISFTTDVPNAGKSDIRRVMIRRKPGIFWVELDAIPENPDNAIIYLYYGNSEATTTSIDMREDFTDVEYIEVDPNNHIEIAANRITFAGLKRDEDAYVYKDFGAGYFDSYALLFSFLRTSGHIMYALHAGLANEIDDASQQDITMVLTNVSVATLYIHMNVKTGGVSDELVWDGGSLGTVYYGVIQKYGTDVFMGIYSDAERTDVLASTTRTNVNDHRYLYGVASLNTGFDAEGAGYEENFFLRKYVDPEPTHEDWGSEEDIVWPF